jgi:Fe-S cluster biogenesis protein NfuA
MQGLFEWSGHPSWEIRGTGLTNYVGTCKGYLSGQDISTENSEALDSHTMLEHAKVVWVVRTSQLRNQRHWTHILCWNMQRLFEWSGHPNWEIRGTGLTAYIGTCKGCLSDQDILTENSEALDSHPMLEHAKVIWVIRTSQLRNQRHWTHILCWNMQRLFEWSGHPNWEIRGTGLTAYIGTCKGCLSDQNILTKNLEALDLHTMLEHAKIVWVVRTSQLRNQRHWTHILCWNMQRLFKWSGHLNWEIRGIGLTSYVGTCKDCLSNQDIPPGKSEALDSQPMLEHAKIVWVIRTSWLRN